MAPSEPLGTTTDTRDPVNSILDSIETRALSKAWLSQARVEPLVQLAFSIGIRICILAALRGAGITFRKLGEQLAIGTQVYRLTLPDGFQLDGTFDLRGIDSYEPATTRLFAVARQLAVGLHDLIPNDILHLEILLFLVFQTYPDNSALPPPEHIRAFARYLNSCTRGKSHRADGDRLSKRGLQNACVSLKGKTTPLAECAETIRSIAGRIGRILCTLDSEEEQR